MKGSQLGLLGLLLLIMGATDSAGETILMLINRKGTTLYLTLKGGE